VLLLFSSAVACQSTFAQKIPFLDSANAYVEICSQLAFYEKTVEVQNNESKLGLYLDYAFEKQIKVFGHTEWAVNLVDNNYSFNASAITDQSIPDALFDETTSAFETRLGYLGVDFKKFGVLTFGKQWSAYYDVSGWTDMFIVFGGQASSTYLTGTDGGETGAGRAAKTMIYRNKFGPLKISLQAQLNGVRNNYGGSLRIRFLKNFEFGVGVDDIRISKETEGYIVNVQDFEVTAIFGLKYEGPKLYSAFNYNLNGGDVIPVHLTDTSLVYGYHFSGYEFITGYNIKSWLRAYGGLNIQIPTTKNTLINDDFHMEYYVLGGEISFSPHIQTYIEIRLDNSVNAEGKNSFNVYTLGLSIDFNKVFHGKE
jgi:predicted porin